VRLTLIPFALAVALVSGCGGSSDSSSAADWANSLCSSITTWSGSVKSAGESLKGGNLSENSLKSATSDISSATDKLASDLKGLGKPDTEGGQQAKDAIDQLSSDVKDGVNAMQSSVEEVSGVNGAVTAASSITATLSTMGTQISSAASKLEQADPKGELDQAFKDAPACKSLTSSSS
jgi:methyl-accepting chemotaxis protein